MRILVTGSRSWPTPETVFEALDELKPTLVIHGGCPTGADAFAEQWCLRTGTEQDVHPAEWSVHGRRAGFLRNRDMVREGPDLVLAFRLRSGSKGTQMTIDLAREAGLKVKIFEA